MYACVVLFVSILVASPSMASVVLPSSSASSPSPSPSAMAMAMAMGEGGEEMWSCTACTFMNHSALKTCEICHTMRPVIRAPRALSTYVISPLSCDRPPLPPTARSTMYVCMGRNIECPICQQSLMNQHDRITLVTCQHASCTQCAHDYFEVRMVILMNYD